MSLRDLRRTVGRLAIVGFDGLSAPDDLKRLAAEFDLGGVIYFARNSSEPRQVAELSREISGLAREWPLWISVDQEGGRVARLKRPFTEWPPMRTLGRAKQPALAERFALAMATELRAVGVTLDFAPVLDVCTNSSNTVIGDRAFSDRPEDVAAIGRVLIRTFQANGITACGKHFPGHGDTHEDSHHELPIVEHDRHRLDAIELPPFRDAIAADVATLMVAHVLVPALDADRPASLSSRVVTKLLKGELAYRGVVFCDDLGMKAVSADRSLSEIMIETLAAGCDVALLCNSTAEQQVEAFEDVIRAVESGRLPEKRVNDALERQHRLKIRAAGVRAAQPALDRVGCDEHQAIANEMSAFR